MEPETDSQQIQRIFWDTQPVPKSGYYDNPNLPAGEIQAPNLKDVPQQPYKLVDQFEWGNLNTSNEEEWKQVYTLLAENYVEDDSAMFRFDYSIDFLKWALGVPGMFQDWMATVKVKKSGKIVAFITAIPLHIIVEGKQTKMAEVNFLCVHKKLRSHRLAPVLIKEITRRVNLRDIWQAVYTAGIVIPTPISAARYHHRSLNIKKLIEIGFCSLGKNQTLSRLIKLYKLPEQTSITGIRPMHFNDVNQVQQLLTNYQKKFQLYNTWTNEEVRHFLAPRKNVIYSYVVENSKKEITDFVSFYSLPSSILKNDKHKELRAAYSFYHVATSVSQIELYNDALIFANQEGFDVFNALDVMDNIDFIKELKFQPGDGYLSYYLYNWLCSKKLEPQQLGLVLV